MRAREFISEDREGKLSQRQQSATRGLNTFSDSERWNSDYTLNRVMMAVAATDGIAPPNIDLKSWAGKSKTAHPYTKEEQAMLKLAYQAAGAKWKDVNHGDMESEEHQEVNTASPVKGFKGYPR
jgi:hypothetical protein